MPLNADQLEAFNTVASLGSYHRAADALFITQSAVTQRIQTLEATLGHKLFVRTGRRVILTQAGLRVLQHCRACQAAEQQLTADLNETGKLHGRLKIFAGTAEGKAFLLPILTELSKIAPDLSFTLTLDDIQDPQPLLESGHIDAILGANPMHKRGFRTQRLNHLSFILVASPTISANWPDTPSLENLTTTHAIDFAPQDRITFDHLAQCLPDADLSCIKRHYVNDTRTIQDWVLKDGGFSVLPQPFVARQIKTRQLRWLFPDQASQIPLYWTHLANNPSAVLEYLSQALQKQLLTD